MLGVVLWGFCLNSNQHQGVIIVFCCNELVCVMVLEVMFMNSLWTPFFWGFCPGWCYVYADMMLVFVGCDYVFSC